MGGPGSASQDRAYVELGRMILWPFLFVISLAAFVSGNPKPLLKVLGLSSDDEEVKEGEEHQHGAGQDQEEVEK